MRFTLVLPQDRYRSARGKRRASRPERVVAIVGVFGILVFGSGYVATGSLAHRVTPLSSSQVSPVPKVPVISARRTPQNLSVITRVDAVERAMVQVPNVLPTGSCLRVDWLDRRIALTRAEQLFTVASANKIIIASVALDILGPTFTYETVVKSIPTSTAGTVGDLYFIGGGDPILTRREYLLNEKYPTINGTSLESLADAIVAAGVKQVTGSIVVDDSRYDDVRFVDTWPQDFHFTEGGPLGALMVDDGVVLGNPVKPDDPAFAAADQLRVLLTQRGIYVSNSVKRDAVPESATTLASVKSQPLTQVLQEMLVNSDNNSAELILKELGYKKRKQGTTAAGLAVVMSVLQRWGIKDVTMFDGSGLSSGNKTSCNTFMTLLDRLSDVLPGLLAIAGTSGTLSNAFVDSPMRGRIVGKTGTLSGVKSLVGYVPLTGSDPLRFALLMNTPGIDNQSAYRPIWNTLADALSRAKATPRPDQLTP